METLLKKPEIFRDSMGRFDRNGKTLSKTAKRTNGHLIKKNEEIKRESDGKFSKGQGGPRAGAGRPKGSKNRVTLQLKEAILNALDSVGGEQYLAKLAIENSSAFSSLLGKILPHTLAPGSESNGGVGVELRFIREIVFPDGRREVQGVTPPKSLPVPDASHALPRNYVTAIPLVTSGTRVHSALDSSTLRTRSVAGVAIFATVVAGSSEPTYRQPIHCGI